VSTRVDSEFTGNRSSFVACGFEHSTARGTRTIIANAVHEWLLRYSTVVKCCGSSGIHQNQVAVGTVESCNFHNNTARNNRAVLSTWSSGMIVRGCVFEGNNHDIYKENNGMVLFVITGCVFSSQESVILSSWTDPVSTDNHFSENTPSLALPYLLHTHYCPTSTPTATPAATGVRFSGPYFQRIVIPGDARMCLHMEDCRFGHLEGDDGGAVFIHNDAGSLFVRTFVDCESTGWGGGALHIGSKQVEIESCCLRETRARDLGTGSRSTKRTDSRSRTGALFTAVRARRAMRAARSSSSASRASPSRT
jgi:hypothetical protein